MGQQEFLADNGCGGFSCIAGQECQIGKPAGEKPAKTESSTEQVECSVHGKTRSMSCMQDDGKGGYKCATGFKCQMSGGGGGKSGGKMSNMMNAAMMMSMLGGKGK